MIGKLAVWICLGLALLLNVLKHAVTLPSGYGIEHFLGFTNQETIAAVVALWKTTGGNWSSLGYLGIAYLGIDLGLFIAAYWIVFLRVAYWLDANLPQAASAGRRHWVFTWIARLAVALVTVDIVETLLGLVEMGGAVALAVAVVGLVSCLAAIASSVTTRQVRPDRKQIGAAAAVAAAVLLIAVALPVVRDRCGCDGAWLAALRCLAHRFKPYLIVATGGLTGVGWLLWLSGHGASVPERTRRALLRTAIGDVLGRTRYVLLGVGIYAALVLGLDQCRDLLVGMMSYARGLAGTDWLKFVGVVVAMLVALWTLSHSCWLWARVACRVPGRGPAAPSDPHVEILARVWARTLGVLPLLVFAQLAAGTVHDLMAAGARADGLSMLMIALIALAVGGVFIHERERLGAKHRTTFPAELYYDDPAAVSASGRVELNTWVGPRYRFWVRLPNAPVWLPLVALIAMVATRLPAGLDRPNWPPMALATMLFAISMWIGLLGWLAVLEKRQSFPWVLVLVGLVGVLGVAGCTENHVVSTLTRDAPTATWPMMLASAALAALVLGVGWCAVVLGPSSTSSLRVVVAIAAALLAFGVLWASNRWSPRASGKNQALTNPAGVPLAGALTRWIESLRASQASASSPGGRVPIYFVATEGGGARAAYWTALALHELSRNPAYPAFVERTFAISGVSGGSVGAAAFVGCYQAHGSEAEVKACIDRLGAGDLASPLIGAWMFEDVLARFVPTSWCSTPACGVLDRGSWFEQAIEINLSRPAGPGRAAAGEKRHAERVLSAGLRDSQRHTAAKHLPYLFLNSTWVETGERAIASEIRIEGPRPQPGQPVSGAVPVSPDTRRPHDFPAARDTLGIMTSDVSLAAAAHNSARFPFVNPIGAVRGPAHLCPGDLYAEAPARSGQPSGDQPVVTCGHVADGGYFDNGGAQTVIDLLRGLGRWLAGDPGDDELSTVDPTLRAWALANLQLQVVVIHNGAGQECARPKHLEQPTADDVKCAPKEDDWRPDRPRPQGRLELYSDFLGPLVTAVNVTGIGANRRRGDALLLSDIRKLCTSMDCLEPQYRRIAHNNNGTLYPLGWYLSETARTAMTRQIKDVGERLKETPPAATVISPGPEEGAPM